MSLSAAVSWVNADQLGQRLIWVNVDSGDSQLRLPTDNQSYFWCQ